MTCPTLSRSQIAPIKGPLVIAIMDGVGIGKGDEADAVAKANTPTLDRIYKESLFTTLNAHGVSVGMPSDEDMGNSEVGHNALGAGRVFDQGAKLVAQAITEGAVFESDTWKALIKKSQGHTLHFIGLLSDGNVHSHIDHLLAMLERASKEGVSRVRIHALLDGRDVPKTSALIYVDKLESALTKINQTPGRDYKVASGGGRMFITMDRYEADWSMVERGWDFHVRGVGRQFSSLREAVETLRHETPGVADQDLGGFVIGKNNEPVGPIVEGDAVVAFNFRGDRMLELVRAFEDDDFTKFSRGKKPNVFFAGMTLYDGDTHRPKNYLVAPPRIACTFGELLVNAGVTQLAVSETQKFGHVTYFWNGNKSGAFSDELEKYVEIPSLQPPFDAHPAMRAQAIADAVVKDLKNFRLVRLNFANGDMVGHTGNFEATVKSVEAVDKALATIIEPLLAMGGALILTADHGNAEDMAERNKKTGEILRDASGHMVPKTSHSLNPVPFCVLLSQEDRGRFQLAQNVSPKGLGNVASTAATLMGFTPPELYLPSLVTPA